MREHRSWLNYIESNVPTIKKIALRVYYSESFFVRLDLFAAESMSSAKTTYSLLDNSSIDLALKNGFTIVPNLHLSFQSRNIIYLNGYLDSKQDLRYWGKMILHTCDAYLELKWINTWLNWLKMESSSRVSLIDI